MRELPDFDALYRADTDPWRVASSFYEQRKLDLVLATLSEPHYRRAWDPASGTGHLAARLSLRSGEVVATDMSERSVEITTKTCAGLDNVVVRRHRIPDDGAPEGDLLDLVVASEFLYYLSDVERSAVTELIEQATGPRAEVLGVHWRHHPHDAYLSGEDVQAELRQALFDRGWHRGVRVDDPDFVLDTFRRKVDRV